MTTVQEIIDSYSYLDFPDDKNGRKFHRLANFVHKLDKAKVTVEDLQYLHERFQRKRDDSKNLKAHVECNLICIHLSWLRSLKNDPGLSIENMDPKGLVGSDGLFLGANSSLEDVGQATFFLPKHERSVAQSSGEQKTLRKHLFEERTKEHFFPRIQSNLAHYWASLESDISSRTLDAATLVRNEFIQFMHKQLLQNVLTHAFADAVHNPNFSKHYLEHYAMEGADFLFGSISYLEISVLDPEKISINDFRQQLASFHHVLECTADERYERTKRRKSRFLAFSYCDTGPGIERHIRHFSPKKAELPDAFDAKFVIDKRIAGRSVARAGEGLSDIRRHSHEANAGLIFETSDSTYIYSQPDELDHTDKQQRVKRGTSVTVFFET